MDRELVERWRQEALRTATLLECDGEEPRARIYESLVAAERTALWVSFGRDVLDLILESIERAQK